MVISTASWNPTASIIVTSLIDTMKFTTSVIAVALAAAAPSVSGMSVGVDFQRIYNRFANVCRVGAGSAIVVDFVTNSHQNMVSRSSGHGDDVIERCCSSCPEIGAFEQTLICKEIDRATPSSNKNADPSSHTSSVSNSIPLLFHLFLIQYSFLYRWFQP